MTEYTKEQKKQVERELVNYYNEVLPFFDEICKETGVPIPKAVVSSSKKQEDVLMFTIVDELYSMLPLAEEWGLRTFVERLSDPRVYYPFLVPLLVPLYVDRTTNKPIEELISAIKVNTASPDFQIYLKYSSYYERVMIHEMSHVLQYRLESRDIAFKAGDNKEVDAFVKEMESEFQKPDEKEDYQDHDQISDQKEMHSHTFVTILYYVAKNIIKDKDFFERVAGNETPKGNKVRWLMYELWGWSTKHIKRDELRKFLEYTWYRIGQILREEGYDLDSLKEEYKDK